MSKSTNVIVYVFDFRYDTTCANDCKRQTDRHTHTETDKVIAIDEFTDLPNN